ncbi:5-formyltetrahydrofolate cyclo-ligase [Lacticaseibacillus porcinae]|uniref:5-formyltetrahydrofolate cyclo-ligase n=1 Tax=Lacticaseibacillus porcinae TaxID=1123687 RepID=UPI001CDD4A7F|nr:5-formyltetrahydrofolate cyclo-ligase [Lacticaseibacillus porcinae]
MNLEKKAFRDAQIKKMQQAASQTSQAAPALLAKLMALPQWQQAKTVGLTVSSPIEVPTEPIMRAATAAGKVVLLPKCMPHRQMAFLPDPGADQRIKSSFGIPEPAYVAELVDNQPDLLIVPGIAYAKDTHARIGFGGGYYDRFLAQYQGPTVTLAAPVMTYDTALWPVEAFDVLLDTIITID